MENEKIIIKTITINLFRNIKNQVYFTHDKSLVFAGTNHLGKTNILNAIYWCLCGIALDNNGANEKANIPFDLLNNHIEGQTLVDVALDLNVGKIRRVDVASGNTVEQHIYINDEEIESLKAGEVQIDEMLGILPLLVKKFDYVNLRRLLLNPMYIYQIKESAFRNVITYIIGSDSIKQTAFEKLPLNVRLSLPNFDYDAENLSKKVSRDINKAKNNIDRLGYTRDFLIKYYPDVHAIGKTNELMKEQYDKLTKNTEISVALDKYVLELNKLYNDVVKEHFPNLTINLFEKGIGEDVWKEKCQVIMSNGISALNGSTSEKMLIALKFVREFVAKFHDVKTLPYLLDEEETLDSETVIKLVKENDTQAFTARVLPKSNGIEVGEF